MIDMSLTAAPGALGWTAAPLASASTIAAAFCTLALAAGWGGFLAAPVHAQALTPDEERLVAWVDANVGGAEALIQELVEINSGTLNLEGVRRVGDILMAEFDALGLETEWSDQSAVNRAGHLIARQDGDRGRKILLIGHLDTVFEADDPFQSLEPLGDGWLKGPGIEDMKAGDVVALYALRALREAGLLDGAQIRVVFTGDEEKPGSPLEIARRDLIDAGEWADVALGFESGIRDDEAEWATIARRGYADWRLVVEGRQAHSSQIFSDEVGAGAIFEAARILDDFYDEVRGEEYLTFNAGAILGGTEVAFDYEEARGTVFGKTNVVPNRVLVHGGIRTISAEQLARAQDAMNTVVERHLPHTDATIEFGEGYPGMAPTEGNRALQRMLSQINQDLGRDPMPVLDPSRRGAADISFVAPYADGLAGLGPYGRGGHSPDEALDMTSIPIAIKRAAILIWRLSNAEPIT